jgi:hypothetical protein
LPRRKIRTRPLELGAAAAAALCLNGCGGAKVEAPPPPAFPRSLATALAARSDAVADALAAGDSCGALAQAHRLQRQTIAAINEGRVPPRLQEQLSSAVNELVARVTCVPPAPAPATQPAEKEDHEQPKQHGKKHGKKHKDDK